MADPVTFIGPDGGTYRFTPKPTTTPDTSFPAAGPSAPPEGTNIFKGPDGGTYRFTPDEKTTGTPNFHGAIIPFSTDEQGKSYFDPLNAGPIGTVKEAVSFPADIARGEFANASEDELISRSLGTASLGVKFRTPTRTVPNRAVKTPTHEELKSTYDTQYQGVRDFGIAVEAQPVSVLGYQIETLLQRGSGFSKGQASKALRLVNDLKKVPPGGDRDLSSIIAIRQELGDIARFAKKPKQRAAATQAVIEVDKFIDSLATNPRLVRYGAGDIDEALKLYRTANENYAVDVPSKTLAKALLKGEHRAESSYSGRNVDNTLRQEARKVLDSEKFRAPAEAKAALEEVVGGTKARNFARATGNRFGGGGGFGQLVTALTGAGLGFLTGGASAAAWLGAAGVGAGITGRTIANKGTLKAFQAVEENLRKRSPLYQERLAKMGPTAQKPLSSLPPKAALATAAESTGPQFESDLPAEAAPEISPELMNLIQALIRRQDTEQMTPPELEQQIIRPKYGDTDIFGRPRVGVY